MSMSFDREPGGAPLPKVETFDCLCGAKWNKHGNTVLQGHYADCGRLILCSCGVAARKHIDGLDGSRLSCEEAARR